MATVTVSNCNIRLVRLAIIVSITIVLSIIIITIIRNSLVVKSKDQLNFIIKSCCNLAANMKCSVGGLIACLGKMVPEVKDTKSRISMLVQNLKLVVFVNHNFN